ncbi:hypothetical protein D9599_03215 [Roseomonas sp. KE2513]|nr:hypothetical protein [Roseomonas sp. KE2513]
MTTTPVAGPSPPWPPPPGGPPGGPLGGWGPLPPSLSGPAGPFSPAAVPVMPLGRSSCLLIALPWSHGSRPCQGGYRFRFAGIE